MELFESIHSFELDAMSPDEQLDWINDYVVEAKERQFHMGVEAEAAVSPGEMPPVGVP